MNSSPLGQDKLKQAKAKAVQYWMDLYLQIIEQELRRQEAAGLDASKLTFARYQTENRPRLKRIARAFQDAGLDLSEDIMFEGPRPHPQGQDVIWPNPRHPRVTFVWPDESELSFSGVEAISAMAFFMFWQNYQTALIPPEPETRIIAPGEKEHQAYFKAKAQDQERGIEP